MLQQRRIQPNGAPEHGVTVHVVYEPPESPLKPTNLFKEPRSWSWRIVLTFAATLIVSIIVVKQLCHFCSSRCDLIDWTQRSLLDAVPVVATQADLDHYIHRREPALLQGWLRDWPAIEKWSPRWFGDAMSDQQVEVFFWGRTGSDWRRTRVFYLTMRQYTALLRAHAARVRSLGAAAAGPAPYLQEDEGLFSDHQDMLLPDVRNLPFRPYLTDGNSGAPLFSGTETETAFWMGPPNARTGIHWDSIDAILHQLHGTKRVTLWPPGAREDLYPSSKYNHGAELSRVDAAAPNYTNFPRFASAKPVSALLPAGSALFLPAGWWHAVTSLDTTISVALRSQSGCQRRAALADDFLQWLHNRGWYKRNNCVCHRAQEVDRHVMHDGGDDEDDDLGDAVNELMRAAGIHHGGRDHSDGGSDE